MGDMCTCKDVTKPLAMMGLDSLTGRRLWTIENPCLCLLFGRGGAVCKRKWREQGRGSDGGYAAVVPDRRPRVFADWVVNS